MQGDTCPRFNYCANQFCFVAALQQAWVWVLELEAAREVIGKVRLAAREACNLFVCTIGCEEQTSTNRQRSAPVAGQLLTSYINDCATWEYATLPPRTAAGAVCRVRCRVGCSRCGYRCAASRVAASAPARAAVLLVHAAQRRVNVAAAAGPGGLRLGGGGGGGGGEWGLRTEWAS